MSFFVLAPNFSREVNSPGVALGFVKSYALKRNGYLGLPSVLSNLGLDLPDNIPVPVVAAPVASDLAVGLSTLGISLENKSIAIVVKSIQQDSKAIVLRSAEVPIDLIHNQPFSSG